MRNSFQQLTNVTQLSITEVWATSLLVGNTFPKSTIDTRVRGAEFIKKLQQNVLVPAGNINEYQVNGSFLYPPEYRKPKVYCCFQELQLS